MHEPLCEVLLEKLCTAVQKVQEQFASGHDVIKDGEPVNQLCESVDEIFNHGLKEGVKIFEHFKSKIKRPLSWILNWASGSETTYWPLVTKITYKEVLQNITRQPSIRTDKERCQVWVRIACQENSLGSYLNIITQDEKLLTDFYQPHAFIFDKEKIDTARTALLYGLSHLDFNISLDIPKNISEHKKQQKYEQHRTCMNQQAAIPANGYNLSYSSSMSSCSNDVSSSPLSSITKGREGPKKKKKIKSSVAVIADSFDEGVGMMTSVERYLYAMSPSQEEDRVDGDPCSASKDVEEISDSFPGNVASDGLNCVNNKEDGTDSFKLLTSPEDKCFGTEVSGVENLGTKVDNISIKDNESIQSTSDISDTHIDGGDNQSVATAVDSNSANTVSISMHSSSNNTEGVHSNSVDSKDSSSRVSTISQSQLNEQLQLNHHDNNIGNSVIATDNEFEYQVSCVRYEYGTPTEHSPCQALKDRSLGELSPEENEDLNFVPGIHKADPWGSSCSGSFGSLTGSGSYSVQTKAEPEKPRRSSTLDSKSSVSSSLPNEYWRYVTNSLDSIERKDSRADDMSVATEDSFSDLGMFEELLGMSEDHFSTPESFMGLSSSEELHHAIVSCKEMIRSTQTIEEKRKLVKRLIQLRMKLQETKEESSTEKIPDAKKILGHQFLKEQDTRTLSNVLCDRCGKWIWTMWQSLFTCQDCQFHSHRKCLDMIRRHCASRKVFVSSYSLSIAPESGLNAQQYKCVECRKMISLTKSGQGEARLCDYSGQYFCENCHWNDHVVIPARIVHNWDFGTYKVSRQTKQFLDLMAKKPILNLDQLNPALFKFVGELREIKRLREEILIMKKYFMSCRSALESKLLLHLQGRQHFVDNSSNYSLQDILEVERGTMLPFVTRVHSLFLTHIKSDCELCRAKGFVCEICRANEIIFAFDPHALQCVKCRTVFHRLCFKKDTCPKCVRIQKRTPK